RGRLMLTAMPIMTNKQSGAHHPLLAGLLCPSCGWHGYACRLGLYLLDSSSTWSKFDGRLANHDSQGQAPILNATRGDGRPVRQTGRTSPAEAGNPNTVAGQLFHPEVVAGNNAILDEQARQAALGAPAQLERPGRVPELRVLQLVADGNRKHAEP